MHNKYVLMRNNFSVIDWKPVIGHRNLTKRFILSHKSAKFVDSLLFHWRGNKQQTGNLTVKNFKMENDFTNIVLEFISKCAAKFALVIIERNSGEVTRK